MGVGAFGNSHRRTPGAGVKVVQGVRSAAPGPRPCAINVRVEGHIADIRDARSRVAKHYPAGDPPI